MRQRVRVAQPARKTRARSLPSSRLRLCENYLVSVQLLYPVSPCEVKSSPCSSSEAVTLSPLVMIDTIFRITKAFESGAGGSIRSVPTNRNNPKEEKNYE